HLWRAGCSRCGAAPTMAKRMEPATLRRYVMNSDPRPSMSIRSFLLPLVAVALIAAIPVSFDWNSNGTYAQQATQEEVAEEKTEVARDLSQAFREVSRALRPSVVSISSTQRVRASQQRGRSQIPDE